MIYWLTIYRLIIYWLTVYRLMVYWLIIYRCNLLADESTG